MACVIVLTDFSKSAQNALQYACAFSAASNKIELLLVNIDSVPASYSGDGVSMAAISDALGNRIASIGLAARDYDLGTGAGEQLRGRLADAAGRAGDQGHLAREIEQVGHGRVQSWKPLPAAASSRSSGAGVQ